MPLGSTAVYKILLKPLTNRYRNWAKAITKGNIDLFFFPNKIPHDIFLQLKERINTKGQEL